MGRGGNFSYLFHLIDDERGVGPAGPDVQVRLVPPLDVLLDLWLLLLLFFRRHEDAISGLLGIPRETTVVGTGTLDRRARDDRWRSSLGCRVTMAV